MDKEDIYTEALERFNRASEAESDNRRDALDDIRFARLGEQWPEAVRQQREREGRPVLTINKLPTYIRQVVNDSRQNKPSIKCHPVDDGSDVKTAEILNGLIRNIEVCSNADIAYDTAIESAVSGGFGYLRIVTDYARDDTFDLDIMFKRVSNPFTIYGDPDAEAGDGSDWRYAFVTEYLSKSEFADKFGEKESDIQQWVDGATGDERKDWMSDDERIRVAEYWVRSEVKKKIVLLSTGETWDKADFDEVADAAELAGITVQGERETRSWKVMQYTLGGGKVLDETEWPGQYIPIVPVYGDELNVEGKKHWMSLIRFAKDPQRMFNYWRTNATELVALAPKAPFIGPAGAFDDPKWATANTETHAFLEYEVMPDAPNGGMPQRQPYAGPPAGALQEALNASDDIKATTGMYDASLGARSNETSGRAIMARQREGDVSTFHFIDNMSRAIRQAGRILVDLIPKVYDKPRVLRILGEDGKPETIPVNQPVKGPDGVDTIYDLQGGRYDVTVHTGPSFTTKREEFAASVSELIRAYPPAGPVLMDMVAKAQDWPEADKVAKRLHALLPPQILQMEAAENGGPPPLPPEVQQQFAQMQQQLQAGSQQFQQLQQAFTQLQAENQKAQADTLKAQLDFGIEQEKTKQKGADLEISRLNAGAKTAEASARFMEAQKPAIIAPSDTPYQTL